MSDWSFSFKVGDIVSRNGDDRQVVIEVSPEYNAMTVRCTKAPRSGWVEVGEEEFNMMRRYYLIERKEKSPRSED